MELRRLEALQNLSGATSKVIFDLAKPAGASEMQAAAVAAAMGANVRVADEQGASRERAEESERGMVEAPKPAARAPYERRG
jgi:hypothetical protein